MPHMDKEHQSGEAEFDPTRKYVRVRKFRSDGFVELEFAIGDPDMFVEMILPRSALAGFCADNDAILLEPAAPAPVDSAGEHWTLADATQQRFRSLLPDSDRH
jgi:phenol hydroxylase P0 protein